MALTAVVTMLAAVFTINGLGDRRAAADPNAGTDDASLTCYDVRVASHYLDSPHTPLGVIVGVLDLGWKSVKAAAQQSSRWADLEAAVTEYHAAGHSGDVARLHEGRDRSLAACQGVPDPPGMTSP